MHASHFLAIAALASAHIVLACYHGGLTERELAEYHARPVNIVKRDVHRPEKKLIAINNVRVFDGHRIGELGTVVVGGEYIAFEHDVEGAVHIDGEGGILIHGLIDSHAHPNSIALLETLSSYGITTVMNMACNPVALCNSLKNQVGLIDFYTAGQFATSPNSTHAALGLASNLIDDPSQAEQWVADRVGNASDYIKLIAKANGMNQATHNAIVQQAHTFGKLAMTHASTFGSYLQAAISKTDIIQHSSVNEVVPPDVIQQMLAQHQVVTPTLTLARVLVTTPFAAPNSTFENALLSALAMFSAGVPLLAGTDSNEAHLGLDVPFGISLHEELENLVEAGLRPLDALKAATSKPAHYFGLHDRGEIKAGKRADFWGSIDEYLEYKEY
jgi:Amidohydrolase family